MLQREPGAKSRGVSAFNLALVFDHVIQFEMEAEGRHITLLPMTSVMEINHKDTKHTKAEDEGSIFLVGLLSLLSIFVPFVPLW